MSTCKLTRGRLQYAHNPALGVESVYAPSIGSALCQCDENKLPSISVSGCGDKKWQSGVPPHWHHSDAMDGVHTDAAYAKGRMVCVLAPSMAGPLYQPRGNEQCFATPLLRVRRTTVQIIAGGAYPRQQGPHVSRTTGVDADEQERSTSFGQGRGISFLCVSHRINQNAAS